VPNVCPTPNDILNKRANDWFALRLSLKEPLEALRKEISRSYSALPGIHERIVDQGQLVCLEALNPTANDLDLFIERHPAFVGLVHYDLPAQSAHDHSRTE